MKIIIYVYIALISISGVFGQGINRQNTNVPLPPDPSIRSARVFGGYNVFNNETSKFVAWNSGKTHNWSINGQSYNTKIVDINLPEGVHDIIYNGDTIQRSAIVYRDLSVPNQIFDVSLSDTLALEGVEAGSIIHLTGTHTGNRFVVRNAAGTQNNPIFVVNATGQIINFFPQSAEWGIVTQNCNHLILGGINKTQYGFVVNGKGLLPVGNNNDVRLCGFHFKDAETIAIIYKNDAIGRDSSAYNNIWIHDNRIDNAGLEGIYLGRFTHNWEGTTYPSQPYGHSVKNAKMFRNKMYNCGWDGLQLGCGDEGSEIHDNISYNCGNLNTSNQNFGFSINSGFAGDVYNNKIVHLASSGGAMQIFPYGNTRVFKNLFFSKSTIEPVFIRTTPNYCPTVGACFTHTLTDINFHFFENTVVGSTNAIYLLHASTVPNNFTPNTPIVIDTLNINNNNISGLGVVRVVGGNPNTLININNN